MADQDIRYVEHAESSETPFSLTERESVEALDAAPETRKVTLPENLPRKARLGEIPFGKRPRVTLLIGGDLLNPLQFEIYDSVILGRGHPAQEQQPDIDLTPYGASKSGLSRFHARIEYRDELMRIEDLNSTNGTYLNGLRLRKHDRRLLRSGDHLQLGSLQIRVYLG